jgi:hypothetical protein
MVDLVTSSHPRGHTPQEIPMNAQQINYTEARRVFLWSQDAPAISAITIHQAFPSINTKYARELLGALTAHNLLYETAGYAGETHAGMTWEQGADVAFKQFFPTAQPTTKKEHKMTTTSVDESGAGYQQAINCLCYCGLQTSRNRLYLPGHDARHASDVAKRILAGEDKTKALNELGSDALRAKAIQQVARTQVKATVRAVKAQAQNPAVEVEPVKIGRWVYPARRDAHGVIVRNTKTDGSGEWVAV